MATLICREYRLLIVQNWYRLLYGSESEISIQDIANIMIQFGDQNEGFIVWDGDNDKKLTISDDSLQVNFDGFGYRAVCGQIDVVKGHTYHWKIDTISENESLNVGIVPSTWMINISGTRKMHIHFFQVMVLYGMMVRR